MAVRQQLCHSLMLLIVQHPCTQRVTNSLNSVTSFTFSHLTTGIVRYVCPAFMAKLCHSTPVVVSQVQPWKALTNDIVFGNSPRLDHSWPQNVWDVPLKTQIATSLRPNGATL